MLILALYLVSIGCSSNIEFELLNSTARRIIPVTPLVPKLGEKKARTLLAAYNLTNVIKLVIGNAQLTGPSRYS
jgi:hypothetical protein